MYISVLCQSLMDVLKECNMVWKPFVATIYIYTYAALDLSQPSTYVFIAFWFTQLIDIRAPFWHSSCPPPSNQT